MHEKLHYTQHTHTRVEIESGASQARYNILTRNREREREVVVGVSDELPYQGRARMEKCIA
jgi:hypothetical protein